MRTYVDQVKLIPALLAVFFSSCIQHTDSHKVSASINQDDTVTVKYARGFSVKYESEYVEVIVHSLPGNSIFADTVYLLTAEGGQVPDQNKVLGNQSESFLCQSSTHLAFLETIGELDKVDGVCGMEYISDQDILTQLRANGSQEICSAESVQIEKVQSINPDLFFIYPFDSEGKQKYDAAGISTFYIAEYLETSALARLEWIKLFGLITGNVREANEYFERVENEYLALQNLSKQGEKRTFFLNLPFKDNWFMPSANSLIVKLIEESGLTYYYPNSGSTENDIHSTEEVWNDAVYADYWIIMAIRPPGYSMADLLAEEPAYSKFKAVRDGQVIMCNTATSNYFSRGVIEPHVMLKDLMHAIGYMPEHEPVYFFKLE